VTHVKRRPEALFRHRHLVGIAGASREETKHVLDPADGYVALNRQAAEHRSLLCLHTIINCYFESSTRPRTSCEVAGKHGKGEEAATV
jgi:aspartate carbamoyltransferase catalytic subunit